MDGVLDVHDLHIWSLGSNSHALSCHVLIEDMPPSRSDHILHRVNHVLGDRFHVHHTTVQFEHMSCAISGTGCVIPVDGHLHDHAHHHAHRARGDNVLPMPEKALTEFWRDLQPISKVFQPDALPEQYIQNAPTDDIKLYIPFNETIFSRPLWISPSQNRWCDILMAKSAGLVNRHYHPHEVFAYTISGKWGYLEHDWTATAGDFIYETPGEGHTLVAYEHKDPMKVFFVVKGPLIWLDDKGEPNGFFDVHNYIAMAREHYEKVGLGANYVETLFR